MSLYRHFTGTNIALVAVFAALIAASTITPEIALASGVPLSLQTFATVLAGLVLGPWRGLAAVSLYLAVGLAGAPIFSHGVAGTAIFGRPSWGYLLGMALAAFVVGWMVSWQRRRGALSMASLLGAGLVSIPVTYAVGVPVLAAKLQVPLMSSPQGCSMVSLDFASGCANGVTLGTLPFLPGDIIKVFLAAAVAAAIHRAYPKVMPARALMSAHTPDVDSEARVTA